MFLTVFPLFTVCQKIKLFPSILGLRSFLIRSTGFTLADRDRIDLSIFEKDRWKGSIRSFSRSNRSYNLLITKNDRFDQKSIIEFPTPPLLYKDDFRQALWLYFSVSTVNIYKYRMYLLFTKFLILTSQVWIVAWASPMSPWASSPASTLTTTLASSLTSSYSSQLSADPLRFVDGALSSSSCRHNADQPPPGWESCHWPRHDLTGWLPRRRRRPLSGEQRRPLSRLAFLHCFWYRPSCPLVRSSWAGWRRR